MSSDDAFDDIAARLEAEGRARRQKLIAEVKANRLDIEAAILRENQGNPEEARRLVERFNKSLDELE